MVNVNLKIQKKDLFLIAAIVVLFAGAFYVIAYNSGASPSVIGHSYEEIGIPTCSNGQGLKWVSSSNRWTCEDYLKSDDLCYCIQCKSACCGSNGEGPEICGRINEGYTDYSFWGFSLINGQSGGCRIKLYKCPW
jgi:hypothetical protein